LCDTFSIQNGLKQGDVLTLLLYNFSLEYTIRKVQENQVRLKLNETHDLLVCADDVKLLGDNISTIRKNTEAVIHSNMAVDVEVNTETDDSNLVKSISKCKND
jgi:hypothetical protein